MDRVKVARELVKIAKSLISKDPTVNDIRKFISDNIYKIMEMCYNGGEVAMDLYVDLDEFHGQLQVDFTEFGKIPKAKPIKISQLSSLNKKDFDISNSQQEKLLKQALKKPIPIKYGEFFFSVKHKDLDDSFTSGDVDILLTGKISGGKIYFKFEIDEDGSATKKMFSEIHDCLEFKEESYYDDIDKGDYDD